MLLFKMKGASLLIGRHHQSHPGISFDWCDCKGPRGGGGRGQWGGVDNRSSFAVCAVGSPGRVVSVPGGSAREKCILCAARVGVPWAHNGPSVPRTRPPGPALTEPSVRTEKFLSRSDRIRAPSSSTLGRAGQWERDGSQS